MPIYEYECTSCGKEFEVLVRNASTKPECPGCSGSDLRKKMSVPAAITGSASAQMEMPASCQGCGQAGGPGACGFAANRQ
jgi:putative FmdB family regulatory protein